MTTSRFVGPGVSSYAMGMMGRKRRGKKAVEYGNTKEETPITKEDGKRNERKKRKKRKTRIRDVACGTTAGRVGRNKKKQRNKEKKEREGSVVVAAAVVGIRFCKLRLASTRADSNLFSSPLFSAPPRSSPGLLASSANTIDRLIVSSIADSFSMPSHIKQQHRAS